jgi:hypothetical protein
MFVGLYIDKPMVNYGYIMIYLPAYSEVTLWLFSIAMV